MSGDPGQKTARRDWLRGGLLLVAATTLGSALWALPFPRSFYDNFPLPGWGWISTLGPYNEHLVRDYGAMNLAMSVLLVSAALSLERRLSQVALLTYLAFAIPHFVFHTTQTHHFSPLHNTLQLGSLGLLVLLAVALLGLTTSGVARIRIKPAEGPKHKGGITS